MRSPAGMPVAQPKTFSDQMSPTDRAKYQAYWARHAQVQSKPFDMMRRYTPDGRVKQVTTYDQFGNRYKQFDLIDERGLPPHYHDFLTTIGGQPANRPYTMRCEIHIPLD